MIKICIKITKAFFIQNTLNFAIFGSLSFIQEQ
jgi:hypothetical protein